MVSNERSMEFPVSVPNRPAAPDSPFDVRWDAWVRRGHIHDQRVRRRFIKSAWLLAVGAALVYAFLR